MVIIKKSWWFEVVFGFKVNFFKSKLIVFKIEEKMIERYLEVLLNIEFLVGNKLLSRIKNLIDLTFSSPCYLFKIVLC